MASCDRPPWHRALNAGPRRIRRARDRERQAITDLADIGLLGLGPMGRNLALNLAGQGFRVAAYDAWAEARASLGADPDPIAREIVLTEDPTAFVRALRPPRAILLMVKAGRPVDQTIQDLRPHLLRGDLVMDGGNAHFRDSERREVTLENEGFHFLGLGISGGAEGARHGPAMMAGGDAASYARVAPLLLAIAARHDGEACCGHFGPGGAGHFVKTLHNGIEYALMQAIAEITLLLRRLDDRQPEDISALFAGWGSGPTGSYLLEITSHILRRRDGDSDRPLIDLISDRAGQKGTGRWTAEAALELAVPAPCLTAALQARGLSALVAERAQAAARFGPPSTNATACPSDEALERALEGAMITAFAEGFAVLRAASLAYDWALDLARVAATWRAGCILRSDLLAPIHQAFEQNHGLASLRQAPALADRLAACEPGWRATVSAATAAGLPAPVLASGLASFDAYRTERLWTNVIQAQRDYFGAHGYERLDRDGLFHTDWQSGNNKPGGD